MLAFDALVRRADQSPDGDALADAARRLGPRAILAHARRIGAALAGAGLGPGDRVAIALPRGIDGALAIHGALVHGASYVPIDLAHPASRLAFIVEDAGCRAVVGRGERPAFAGPKASWIDLDALDEGDEIALDPGSIHAWAPEEIAAILYTSGSTGMPKGIAVSARAVDAFVRWAAATFDLDATDRIASLAPFHFDLSLFDLFASMHAGAAAVFVPQALTLAPSRLVRWMEAERITTFYTVPSLLGFLAARGGLGAGSLPSLRRILFAGEVFPLPALQKLAAGLPHVALYNLFGPTETNVCAFFQVDRARLGAMSSLPIGAPACDAELSIDGEGELHVRGPCVMSGYLKQGAIPAPIAPGSLLATGDRVDRNEQGELLFLGRMDRMIKSAGYRVEPAEIEAALERFPGVRRAVAFGLPDPVSGQRIVAAIAADEEPASGALIAALRARLAPAMIPTRILWLPDLPLLANGKTDLAALAKLLEDLGP
ncbi:MAG: AMP-binding protein [Byssovorax sp.]